MPTIHDLVRDHLSDVYGYAYRLAGNRPDADDLTQQTFLTAQQHLEQLRDATAARGWLWTIARRCFLAQCRKKAPMAIGDLSQHEAIDTLTAEWVVADNLLAGDFSIDREMLDRAVAELPAEFRLVLTRFYFEDASYREIAAELDLPLGTVMSRLSRAKSHLRKRLLRAAASGPVAIENGGNGNGAVAENPRGQVIPS